MALLSLALAACPAGEAGLRRFEKGMVFGLFARDDAGHADRNLGEMKALGVDAISIVVPWVTPDVRSTVMAPRDDMTPGDAALTASIRKAHELGMTVFLMPFLYVDTMGEGEWRGTLKPPDWRAWFDAYGAFILHYAAIAGRERVEYFSIGSELCSTEKMRDPWMSLIRRVREVYQGKITYSANWDHRGALSFADGLDLLGMNAYFKLSEKPGAREEDLVLSWDSIRREVEEWRRPFGKRLLITEVGYPSRTGAAVDPWNYDAAGAPDLEEQRRCYRAFERVWSGDPELQGVYFYMWWGEGGPSDTGYTPRGKPAATVIRDWYLR